jgi:hypothetical protein
MLQREWLVQMLLKITVSNTKTYNFQEIKSDFETNLDDFYSGTQSSIPRDLIIRYCNLFSSKLYLISIIL